MEKVTGIGGVVFKANDAEALATWYCDNLGVDVDPKYGYAQYDMTVWTIMKSTTKYFDPSTKDFMINDRVANIDAMLAQLRAAGGPSATKSRTRNSAASAGRSTPKATTWSSGNRRSRPCERSHCFSVSLPCR